MFVRFVLMERDEKSLQQRGDFTALYRLQREHRLADHDEVWVSETETWFNEHLKAPNRFQLSKRPGAPHSAITWLKASAVDHVRRMRELAALLENKDVHIERTHDGAPG